MATSVIPRSYFPKFYQIATRSNPAIIQGAAEIVSLTRKTLFCFANTQNGETLRFSIFSRKDMEIEDYLLKTKWLDGHADSISTEVNGNDLYVYSDTFRGAWGGGIAILVG